MSTPIRLVFHLRTPMVIPSTSKSLDALLSWAAVSQAEFNEHLEPWSVQHDIGLERHEVGQAWCFKASNVDITWSGDRSYVHYIKRAKLDDYMNAWDNKLLAKRPAFDPMRGTTKAGSYIQPIRWVNEITAYAIASDIDRVRSLMPWLTHIGKLWHKDFGAVKSWQIVEDEDAELHWSKRNLPTGSPRATNHVPAVGALVSPYWMRENHIVIAVPASDLR